jgi:pimeloyl-ACP methyl ester carboxylesterase
VSEPSPPAAPPASPVASPAASPSPSPAATVRREGRYEGGSYRIVVPPNWNGGLVMYAHGIQRGAASVADPPISQQIQQRGYAWAASSYRAAEYVPHLGMEDTLALKRLFVREVGQPRVTILYGQSMGGQLVTASLETWPDEYQAGFAECGLVDGIWEIDYLFAYTAAAELISGVPLLDAPDQNAFGRLLTGQWIPTMGRPGEYTEKGRQFDSVVKYLMGGDLPYRLDGLKPRYLANLFRREDPETTREPAQRHVDTQQVVYQIDPGLGLTADELNARVRRAKAPPGARDPAHDPAFAERSGRIGVPLLTLHTTGDAWVPFSHEQRYRRRTIAAGTDHLLVQRAFRRSAHCDNTAEERVLAFDDLVRWLETGTRPDGDDVLASDLSGIGLRWTTPLNVDDPARGR